MKEFDFTSEKVWQPAGEGVVRQVMSYNDDLMVVRVKFVDGAVGSDHTHPHTQISYVESGRFEYHIEDRSQEIGPGDSVVIAPNLVHGCKCLEAGVLIDCFNPMRKDFV